MFQPESLISLLSYRDCSVASHILRYGCQTTDYSIHIEALAIDSNMTCDELIIQGTTKKKETID